MFIKKSLYKKLTIVIIIMIQFWDKHFKNQIFTQCIDKIKIIYVRENELWILLTQDTSKHI